MKMTEKNNLADKLRPRGGVRRILAAVMMVVMVFSLVGNAAPLTVSAASGKYVKSLKVSKSSVTLTSGSSATVKATVKVKGSAAKKVKVVQTAATKKVVSVKTGKTNGKGVTKITLTGKSVTKKTTVTLKIRTKAKNNKGKYITKKLKVTVNPAGTGTAEVAVTGVTASISQSAINVGETATVTASIKPSNATNKSVTYTSGNTSVAAVDGNGTVVGIGAGTTDITVTTSNGLTATVNITVYSVAVSGVTLDQSSVTMTITGTVQLKATIAPTNATDKTIIWTSSNQSVATVSSDGIVTGLSAGTATITATASSGVSATCEVTVTSASVLSDGLSLEVTNPYTDGDGNVYANTVLVGNDMTVRVRVISDGAPLGNASVTLTMAAQYGNAGNDFEVRTGTQTTDANGYATFVVGLKSSASHTAVDGTFQSFKVTARESGSNTTGTLLIKFASVSLSGVTVENGNGTYPDIVPSDNAEDGYDGVEESYYLDSTKTEQFVSSQQVSSFDSSGSRVDDHRVYLSAAPYLILPATEDNAHTGDWVSDEVDASNSVSIYNGSNNTTVTSQSFTVPAGLQYLTLQLNDLALSRYTRMSVTIYDAATGDRLYNVNYGYISNDSSSLQLQQQTDSESYLVVSIVSEGQISTSGSTCVLAGLTGVWESSGSEQYTEEEIDGSVTWETVENVGYESLMLTYDLAEVLLPSDSAYLSSDYNYSVKVPVFPYTGNAQIIVKDSANTETLAIYLYPVENYGDNTNALSSSTTAKAILASTEEASQSVGTLETDGNLAIVDSTATGSTMLKATVNVAGLTESELAATNGATLYTSVQWAPVPTEAESAVYPDYFAIEGQYITVTAQLYDKNGNIKTDSGEKITFSADNTDDALSETGSVGGDADGNGTVNVISISNSGSTDSNGIVTLVVYGETSSDGYCALLEGLTATSTSYSVKLTVGNDSTGTPSEKCNLYWVDLGLTFVNSAYTYETDGTDQTRTTVFDNSTKSILDTAYYTVSGTDGWKIGYQVVARSAKFAYNYLRSDGETEYLTIPSTGVSEFISVSGVGIEYAKTNKNVSFELEDDMIVVYSTTTGTDVITGKISVENPEDVTFTFYNEDGDVCTYDNIGSSDSLVNVTATGLQLTTVWNPSGLAAETYSPGSGNVNANQAAKVFIKVTDSYGNLISDGTVTYSISGVNSTTESQNAEEVTDSEGNTIDGVFVIELDAPKTSGTCIITYTVNGTLQKSLTLNYIADPDSAFTIGAADGSSFDVSDDLQTVTVYFSNTVDSNSINANEFTFYEGSTQITVTNAEKVSGYANAIKLTLETAITSTSSSCTLTVGTYTDKTGIEYSLIDEYGQMITSSVSKTFVPNTLN